MVIGFEVHIVGLVEGGVVVEEVGHEGHIEFVDALHHVLGGEETAAPELVCLLQHNFRPANHVAVLGGND